jgi:1-pyrroline-5-carboxylate dehydrogenase
VQPTLVETSDAKHRLMREEIFGPVLTVLPYDNKDVTEALELVNASTPYALTGAIWAQDRRAIAQISRALTHSAGNFYVNDKPTGAVVGQQPFGGSRLSGTNDKPGGPWNLLRWCSPRTIKETFVPPTSWRYPHMG